GVPGQLGRPLHHLLRQVAVMAFQRPSLRPWPWLHAHHPSAAENPILRQRPGALPGAPDGGQDWMMPAQSRGRRPPAPTRRNGWDRSLWPGSTHGWGFCVITGSSAVILCKLTAVQPGANYGEVLSGRPSANGVDEDTRGSAAPVRRPPPLAPYSGCRAAEVLP